MSSDRAGRPLIMWGGVSKWEWTDAFCFAWSVVDLCKKDTKRQKSKNHQFLVQLVKELYIIGPGQHVVEFMKTKLESHSDVHKNEDQQGHPEEILIHSKD